MNSQAKLVANYLGFFILLIVFCGIQASLWLQLFGYFPAPQLWIPILAFWSIYRKIPEGILMIYIICAYLSGTTAMPFNLILFNLITLAGFAWALKARIYWPGVTYFMLACGALTTLFPIVHALGSFLIESNPISDFQIIDWILSALITTLFALPLYPLFQWIDSLTEKELPTETGAILYE